MHAPEEKSTNSDKAFSQLYSEHHRWLLTWLQQRMAYPDNAPDAAQDTWLRILASHAHLSLREPRAFLATTARRLLIDRARRQSIEQAYLESLQRSIENQGGEASPEQILEAVQLLTGLAEVLNGLSAKARQAFLMRHLDGASHAQIAEHLGVSNKMVQKYLVQALLKCHANIVASE